MSIPAVLNRIWVGSPPPQDYVENADTWRERGFEVIEWDEDRILALGLENRDIWDLAPSIQPSRLVPRLRSDIARYEILWRFGGVYADHDFRCLRPVLPHIAGLTCFAVEEKPGLIANGFMGCVAGHPFMRLLVDELADSVRKQPRQQTWRMAGPGFVTRMAKGRGDLTVLDSRRFLPYHHTDIGKEVLPDDAVLDHSWGSARGQVSVIIPWRTDGPERQNALDHVTKLYRRHRDWQVVIAEHNGGEFNKAQAVNEGVRRSFGDVLVIADADLVCPGVDEAVQWCRKGSKWVMPYTTLWRLSQQATGRFYAGDEGFTAKDCDLPPYPGVIGGGVVVVQRRYYEAVPMDERFVGWGGEDIAWGLALRALLGAPRHVAGPLYHLWHPSEHIGDDKGSPENYDLYRRYAKAARNAGVMRRLVKEAKAHA